jgi:site-specific DNA-cytosine methylase
VAVAQPDRLERVFAGRAETRATLRGGSDWWSVEPGMGRMADGVPHRVDRLRAIGNGVVPQIAFWLGKKILEREAMRCA